MCKTIPLATVMLLISTTPCLASPQPDAGQLLQEQNQQKQLPDQLPTFDEKKESTKENKGGVRVHVRAFSFTGYEELISEDELQALVAEDIDKDLSFIELQAVAAKVTRHLKSQGWLLARAYLPKQDVTEGTILIVITQGKSDGSLNIIDDGNLRIDNQILENIGKQAVHEGEPLKSQDLERVVLLMNDLPGISAKASLSPGSMPDTSAVEIKASEGPLLNGALWADNYGNRYTGTWRGNAMVNVNDPFHIGDRISVTATGAENLYLGKVKYSLPLASNGLSYDISYTHLHYDLGKELSSLDADGEAQTINTGVSYPWLRSRKANITGTLNYEYRRITDSASGTDLHNKKIHVITAGVKGDNYDGFNGGGLTTWNASVTGGHLNEETADIEITDAEGKYAHINAGLARLQRLTKDWSANLSWRGQFSFNNLDSSEQFSLGGPYGVRAYPVSEGQGDEGHLFTIQSDYNLPLPSSYGRLKTSLFYDAGYITLHESPWENAISTATNKNHYWLQGAGLGFTYTYSDTFNITTSWAHTIGDNDGRSTSDDNADGKNDNSRFWIQSVWHF